MRLVQDDRTATSLPEMAGALAARMNDPGIAAMHRRQRPPQPVRIGGHQDEMYVIGHQAPRPNLDIGRPAMLAQEIAVERIVGVAEEGAGTAIAALGDVMRQTGNDDACEASHGASLRIIGATSIKCTVTVIATAIKCTVTVIAR